MAGTKSKTTRIYYEILTTNKKFKHDYPSYCIQNSKDAEPIDAVLRSIERKSGLKVVSTQKHSYGAGKKGIKGKVRAEYHVELGNLIQSTPFPILRLVTPILVMVTLPKGQVHHSEPGLSRNHKTLTRSSTDEI
jgi:hypothetical protein